MRSLLLLLLLLLPGCGSFYYWRLTVNSPRVSNYSQTLFQYSSTSQDFHGVILVFDDSLTLETVRRGYLADITKGLRNPPAYIED